MKKVFLPGILLAVVFLLYACGPSVKMIGSWVDDSMVGYSIKNVLVIGISRDDSSQKLWENTFVELLVKKNIKAQASHIVMGGESIEPNKQSIKEAVIKSGADTVLITYVAGSKTKSETLPGSIHYEPLPYYAGMYDYYGHAFRAVYSPPTHISRKIVRLESNFYDVATAKLIWTAQSETIDPKLLKTDFTRIVGLFMDDLQKKKLL